MRIEWASAVVVACVTTVCTWAQVPIATPAGIEATINQKPGAWETLKIVQSAPTLNDAHNFGNALPLGNGRLGAKVFGGPASEVIPLNDTTFWSGSGPEHFESPKHHDALVELRKALAKPDYVAADQLARQMEGPNTQFYEPLADLRLDFPGHETYTAYSNTLDLDSAVATTRYTITSPDGAPTTFTREMFISYPSQVMVLRLSANRKSKLTFSVALETQQHYGNTVLSPNEITITGRAPIRISGPTANADVQWDEHRGTSFEAILHISTKGGLVAARKNSLSVSNTDEAVILISAATSFNEFDHDPATEGKNPDIISRDYIAKAAGRSYDSLLTEHLADFHRLFRRLWVSINNETPNRYALGYQYARYVLISSSRPGSGAMRNEQGIWNHDLAPHYSSNFTLNENPEKYYAAAEPANVGETVEPEIDFVNNLAKNGAATANVDYGFHGWVVHHNSDIWAMTTMVGGDPCWADWPAGGFWLSQALWERYAFGLDQAELRTKIYPVLKGASEFALDLLVPDKDGHLVTSPSTSPENHFIDPVTGQRVAVSRGSTMDMALIRELFSHTIQASEILDVDADLRARIQSTIPKLLPFQIGSKGQLQEWAIDFKEWEPTHRHASHLVSVSELDQITCSQPELFAAARVSEILRQAGGYHPDKAALWARLFEGDEALAALGTRFPTMYDSPPAGFGEMLLQSHTGTINLLPALPAAWKEGQVLGMRARGGYEVDIAWSAGILKTTTIRSLAGDTPRVEVSGNLIDLKSDPRVNLVMTGPKRL